MFFSSLIMIEISENVKKLPQTANEIFLIPTFDPKLASKVVAKQNY